MRNSSDRRPAGASSLIRWSAVAAVAAVAGIAGWVSYIHTFGLVSTHGETGMVGRLYPATIDGMIYVSSMVLLDAARRGVRIRRWPGGCWPPGSPPPCSPTCWPPTAAAYA